MFFMLADNIVSVKINDNGTWKEITKIYHKNDGQWKPVENAWTKKPNSEVLNFWSDAQENNTQT
jgi:hypothetical protein